MTESQEAAASSQVALVDGDIGEPATARRIVDTTLLLALGSRAPGVWTKRLVMGTYNRQFAPNRTPSDWLSRDPAEVDRFRTDPLWGTTLCPSRGPSFCRARRRWERVSTSAAFPKRLPTLLISGTRDRVGENGQGVRRLLGMYQAAGLECVCMKLYEDARHELANETIRDEVTADVISWLDETVRPTRGVADGS